MIGEEASHCKRTGNPNRSPLLISLDWLWETVCRKSTVVFWKRFSHALLGKRNQLFVKSDWRMNN